MITHFTDTRKKRQARIQAKLRGTSSRPRVSVFRSPKFIYVQLIDDVAGTTLFGINEKNAGLTQKNKIERAHALGLLVAQKAKKQKIATVVFDRGGFTYHGRIKALADGLREGGLTV